MDQGPDHMTTGEIRKSLEGDSSDSVTRESSVIPGTSPQGFELCWNDDKSKRTFADDENSTKEVQEKTETLSHLSSTVKDDFKEKSTVSQGYPFVIRYLQERVDFVTGLYNNLKSKFHHRVIRNMKLQHKIQELSTRLGEIMQERDKLYKDVRIAQEGAFRSMEKKLGIPKEDDEIRGDIALLRTKIEIWTRDYSHNHISGLDGISGEEKDRIICGLEGYSFVENWHQLECQLPSLKARLPQLLTQAYLAKTIFDTMFTGPFFLFSLVRNTFNTPTKSQLDSVYSDMIKIEQESAILWRTLLIHHINICLDCPTKHTPLRKCLEDLVLHISTKILDETRPLLRDIARGAQGTDRFQKLIKIVQRAAELALSLWEQQYFISALPWSCKMAFSSSANFVRAHRLHCLDDKDTKMDGKPILLLTLPPVTGWGNGNGENYDKHKVWAEGVVVFAEVEM